MSWLYQNKIYHSLCNGPVVVKTFLGQRNVYIHDINYTSRYLQRMWEAVLAPLAKKPVERVLMLGLGAGQQLKTLDSLFHNPDITVIEIDPVMIEIARLLHPESKATILPGDVRTVVPTLHTHYDLVIIDLFDSTVPQETCGEMLSHILPSIHTLLPQHGKVVINLTNKSIDREETARFSRTSLFPYKHNRLCVLEK